MEEQVIKAVPATKEQLAWHNQHIASNINKLDLLKTPTILVCVFCFISIWYPIYLDLMDLANDHIIVWFTSGLFFSLWSLLPQNASVVKDSAESYEKGNTKIYYRKYYLLIAACIMLFAGFVQTVYSIG